MSAAVSHLEASHSDSRAATPVRDWISQAGQRLGTWVEAYAAASAAAALYAQLSRLSDAELYRRGLSRETLARDVAGTFGGS